MTSYKNIGSQTPLLMEQAVDQEAVLHKGSTRRTQSLCHLNPAHYLRSKPIPSRAKRNNSMAFSDGGVPVAVASSKNAVWRVRSAFKWYPRKTATSCPHDHDSLDESLDSIESFLKVVHSNPKARTLAQKELAKTLRATRSSFS